MDLRFVGILFIFGSCLGGCLAAVFLHCLDRFLLGRNLKRVCKSQELPGPRKCSPHKCEPLLDSYFPTNPNMMCGYIPPPPSYEHEHLPQSSGPLLDSYLPQSSVLKHIPSPPSYEDEYLPQSSGPTNTRPSFFNWASCRALLPHSSGHDLPQFSGPTNTPANFLDWGSGRAPSNEHQYSCLSSSFPESAKPLSTSILLEILRESFKSKGPLPSSPMGPMGPIDKGYVKHFPAMNKLPGISAAATSVTGCDSAHVIGMDEWKDCSAAQPTGEALMNNLL